MTENHAPALWRQLQWTAKVIGQVGNGRSGTAALEEIPLAWRPGVQSLSFAVLRSLGMAQSLMHVLVKRAPAAPVAALLSTVLALLCREEDVHYDAFTLVNQAVEAAKNSHATRPQAAFINACLRRFLRERVELTAQVKADPVARFNHPAWWILQLQKDWPDHWEDILAANNAQAPLTLRVNIRKISRKSYLALLDAAGLRAIAVGENGIELCAAVPVRQLPEFAEGFVSVQDSAAQMAADFVLSGLPRGKPFRVLDACAAPGGKTAHLLESADCEVTALDIDALRCERVRQNLTRLGLSAKVITADAADVTSWWDGVAFDAILLDAPCSASGIVRRHPDIRWLRRPGDLAQLAALQVKLLDSLWTLLKPSGRLLYSTCSVFKAEGELPIKEFLGRNSLARLLPCPGHLLPGTITMSEAECANRLGNHDGFYYALLEKTLD